MKSITLNLFKHPYKLKKRARPRWVFCLATVKLRKKRIFNGKTYDLRVKYWIPRSRNIEIRIE